MAPFDQTGNNGSRVQVNSRWAVAGCPWLWLLALLAVGCSRAPTVVPPQPMEAQHFQGKRGGVSVGVDPYIMADRVVQTFRGGDNFAGSGVLPIQVTIENGSGEEISVNSRDFRLARPDAQPAAPLSAQDAFSLVKLRIQYWALIPIVGTSVTAARNEPILKDLEARQMREGNIPPGGTTTGFVYFQVDEALKDLAGAVMVVVAKGLSGQDLIYEIAIEGRRDMTPRISPSGPAGSPAPSKPAPSEPKKPQDPTRIEGTGGGVIIRSPAQ